MKKVARVFLSLLIYLTYFLGLIAMANLVANVCVWTYIIGQSRSEFITAISIGSLTLLLSALAPYLKGKLKE